MQGRMRLREEVLAFRDELVRLRRDFHRYPEKAFEEVRTAEVINKYLNKCGIPTRRVAKTGVIGTLDTGKSGKVLALRADMDALPLSEKSDVEYRSVNEGVMHACGHDGHMAILLCVAKYMSERKGGGSGAIRFIFQPGEEGAGGALKMIEEGCLKDPDVDAIVGLHLWSRLASGQINTLPGPMMACTFEFKITVKGKGGHGAIPQETVDSIVVASQVVNNVQSIISRNIDPFEPGVITFGTISGGSNYNIIAPEVCLTGTIRAMSEKVLDFLKNRLEEILKNVCMAYGADYEWREKSGYIALVNDPGLTEFVVELASDLLGYENIRRMQSMGGEDFAYYGKHVPACFFFVGAGSTRKGISFPQHHPQYDIDEDALLIGMELMTRVCEKYCGI